MRCLTLSFRPSITHCSECSYAKAAPPLTSLFTFYRVLSNKYNVTYLSWIDQYTISFDCLPRSMRTTSKDWSGASDPPIVDGLVKLFTPRTLRLLRNVDKLEREVLDSNPSHGRQLSVSQEDTNEAGIQLSDEELRRALQLARSAKLTVPRYNRTEEFYVACEEEDWGSDWGWEGFKEKCRNRRAWGEYFCSELD